jgi:tetratricopeptide (TPR) repeat protein
MISRKTRLLSALSLFMFVFLAFPGNAQTINEVIEAFNAAAEDVNTGNFESAISKFENCINLATQLGAEGDEMKAKAEGQIPALYYKLAIDAYKAKDYEGAIEQFEQTVVVCDQYGNEDLKSKSLKYLPSLHYVVANEKYKEDDFESAMTHFDKAIEYNPEYAKAYFGKGLVYQKKEDTDHMLSTFEKTIEVGNASGDEKTADFASQKIRDHYYSIGSLAVKDEDFQTAVDNLTRSLEYDAEFSEPYYLLSVMYNKEMEYQKAAENAEKALQYDQTEPQLKARIYYELGNAYIGLVEYDKACEAFSNALHEPYTNTVQYKMENVINCE